MATAVLRRRRADPAPVNSGHGLERAGYACLTAFCAVLCFLAVRMLIADLNAYQASLFVSHWSVDQEPVTEQAWDIAHRAALRAVDGYPAGNGDYSDRLGKVYEWRHPQAFPGAEQADATRRLALDAYRQAVQVRPHWPYTWNRIAWVKAQLLEFDDEFDHALHNAFDNGPWRWKSNLALAKTGLFAWHELTAEQKSLIAQALENLQTVHPKAYKDIMEYAEKRRLTGELATFSS
jgi:polysaccharide biosynthesis protein VpsP